MSTAIDAPKFDGGVEDRVVDGFTSLLDEVDSEEIAARHEIGLHSNRIDFLEHVKIGLRLGIDDPNTLEDLAQQTDVYADLEPISKGHFSKLTTRRPFQAVAELATAVSNIHPYTILPGSLVNGSNNSVNDRSSAVTQLVSRSERRSSSIPVTTRSSFAPKMAASNSILPLGSIRP